MNALSIALLVSTWLPLAAGAPGRAEPSVVAQEVAVAPGRTIAVSADAGEVAVNASESPVLSYRVEFKRSQTSWLEDLFRAPRKDCDGCSATYTPAEGLKVHSGKGYNAIVAVKAPSKSALDAKLEAGTMSIGRRAGKVNASIGAGILEYDASAVPAGACVSASIKAGVVTNERDVDCRSVRAVLRGGSGIITVK